jgi:hypothetical protein
VAEYVIGLGKGSCQGKHDPSPKTFGHSASSFPDISGDCASTSKVRVAGIEDKRLPGRELVTEHLRKPRIPALRHARNIDDNFLHVIVIMNVKVLGLEYVKL